MKGLSFVTAAAAVILLTTYSCNKSSYSSGPDRTRGMTNLRSWSGTSSGYGRKDTIISGAHTNTAVWFSRAITDTSFAIQKVNDFAISITGILFQYKGTDSIAQTVKYDSLLSGAGAISRVTYYYSHDSITFELHQINEWDSIKHRNYTLDLFLHTTHS